MIDFEMDSDAFPSPLPMLTYRLVPFSPRILTAGSPHLRNTALDQDLPPQPPSPKSEVPNPQPLQALNAEGKRPEAPNPRGPKHQPLPQRKPLPRGIFVVAAKPAVLLKLSFLFLAPFLGTPTFPTVILGVCNVRLEPEADW